jgi:hypothetical protein
MVRIGRMDFHIGMQQRRHNGANPTWLGFAYGSWLPVFRLRRNSSHKELSGHWLCFHGFITVWSK